MRIVLAAAFEMASGAGVTAEIGARASDAVAICHLPLSKTAIVCAKIAMPSQVHSSRILAGNIMAAEQTRSVTPGTGPIRDRTAISNPHLHRLQTRHFVLFDVLPALGTAIAFVLLAYRPIGPLDIGLFLAMWLATGLGMTVGFHRLLSHGAFGTPAWIRAAFVIVGSRAARGAAISWVAMHRRHHERADHHGDLHSPNLHGTGIAGILRGLLHAQLTWMVRHDYPNVSHYVPDLLRDEAVIWANKRYRLWIGLGLLLPAAIGGLVGMSWWAALTGFLWGGVVRIFVVEQTISLINSLLHRIGSRPFKTRIDNSRNFGPLSLLSWGEAWHNNHHAFPYSAAFGLSWYEFDPGFWLIRCLEALGLAWNVRVPAEAQITAKRATADD